MEMKAFNQQVIEEFRANSGKVAMFADYPMVMLHTIGAKSGKTHLVPLVLTITMTTTCCCLPLSSGQRSIPVGV
jgi:hypothetical protein|tara:strand:+ start:820 stop:1041 length:222 start_codon:yes stop_codon:yes gene_type:complete